MPSTTEADDDTKKWYQSAVGSLMWASLHSRPDVHYAVTAVSKYASNPGQEHCSYVIRIFRYLKGTLTHGLVFTSTGSNAADLVGYSDSDFAAVADGRKSTGAYVFMLAGAPISHQAKQQPFIALSTCEAEYMALVEAGKEAIWLGRLLNELCQFEFPILLYGDNQGANSLTVNPEYHRRTKHIDVRYHWIRDQVDRKVIHIEYIPTKEMVADGLTKPLPVHTFKAFVNMLGLTGGRR